MDEMLSELLSPAEYTLLSGHDLARDPGLAHLRRFLPVLAVIAAPYAALGGDQDPLNPLDPVVEWRTFARLVAGVTARGPTAPTRLAVVRLTPPTAQELAAALQDGGPDTFRMVHIVCHGERDMLYLEDEDGFEAYAVEEQLPRLFKHGSARLVILEGCFSRRIADLLVRETAVQAVLGTRRRVSPENSQTFNEILYSSIAGGAGVREAYRAALGELKARPGGQADRFELVIPEELYDVRIPLPRAAEQPPHPLVATSGPRQIGVPPVPGFVGRRELLRELAQPGGPAIVALHGPAGIGKTWLAAQAAARFAWRYPDGVLWVECLPVTTATEIAARTAAMLGYSPYLPAGELAAALPSRRILVVLDQLEQIPAPFERDRVAGLVMQIAAAPGSRVILTMRQTSTLPLSPADLRARTLDAFTPREARTLAMRLAVEGGVEVLDVDTIDEFVERTLNLPWLIAAGVQWVGADGIAAALERLRAFSPATTDIPGAYVREQLEWLVAQQDTALRLLVRAQHLPDGIEDRLAQGLGGQGSAERLLRAGLLHRDHDLYRVPAGVGAWVGAHLPQAPELGPAVSRAIMNYLVQSWPGTPPATPLPRVTAARLNNTRALLRQQVQAPAELRPDPIVVARLLSAAGPTFRAAGLAQEFIAFAQGFREMLPEGNELGCLQIVMGDVVSALPGQDAESGWLYLSTLRLAGLDRDTHTEASRAFGAHLRRVEQVDAAEDHMADALRTMLREPPVDVRLASLLAHEWGSALAVLDRHDEAIKRFEAALSGYLRTHDLARAVLVRRELSRSLGWLGRLEEAEDHLRHAVEAADSLGQRDLAGDVRHTLALLLDERATRQIAARRHDEGRAALLLAESILGEAVLDLLPGLDRLALADALLDLAQIQARLGGLDDGAANAGRSRAYYGQAGHQRGRAEALITLGQLHMLRGNSVAAQAALDDALDAVAQVNDRELAGRAGGVLVRVHQIRARHARRGDADFVRATVEHAHTARERLKNLGLDEHAAALEHVIRGVTAL